MGWHHNSQNPRYFNTAWGQVLAASGNSLEGRQSFEAAVALDANLSLARLALAELGISERGGNPLCSASPR